MIASPSGDEEAAIDTTGTTCIVMAPVPFSKATPTMAFLAPGLCDVACSTASTDVCTHVNYLTQADVNNYICQLIVCIGPPTVTPTTGATAKEKVCPSTAITTEVPTTLTTTEEAATSTQEVKEHPNNCKRKLLV